MIWFFFTMNRLETNIPQLFDNHETRSNSSNNKMVNNKKKSFENVTHTSSSNYQFTVIFKNVSIFTFWKPCCFKS